VRIVEAWFTDGFTINMLSELPSAFFTAFIVFLFSAHFALPILFMVLITLHLVWLRGKVLPQEVSLLISAILLFAFLNLGPAPEGWQMRGDWIARLYQPLAVLYIFFVSRMLFEMEKKKSQFAFAVSYGSVTLTFLFHLVVVFGPILGFITPAQYVHHRFYRHAKPFALEHNLQVFGRRPLGICLKKWRNPTTRKQCYQPQGKCYRVRKERRRNT
jgi:hypothetical protein